MTLKCRRVTTTTRADTCTNNAAQKRSGVIIIVYVCVLVLRQERHHTGRGYWAWLLGVATGRGHWTRSGSLWVLEMTGQRQLTAPPLWRV